MFASAAFRGTSQHGIYGDAVHEVDWSVGGSVIIIKSIKNIDLVICLKERTQNTEKLRTEGFTAEGF